MSAPDRAVAPPISHGRSREVGAPERSRRLERLAWGIPIVVLVGISLPLFSDRTFGNDWPDHLWLVWQQSQAISQLGHPSYFLQTVLGVFEPFYAFYGGTFYSFTGGISALLGDHPTVAYIGVIIAAFAGAYAGWTWLARQLGVRGWLAHMPGAIYVTSPYIITAVFGRGDVPEFVATSAMPMLVASALALLRAERLTWRLSALVVVSATWFTACHNISALWGTTFLVFTTAVVLAAAGPERKAVGLRRIGALLGFGALGVLVNAWYLFPAAAYSGTTAIAKRNSIGAPEYDTSASVFGVLREGPKVIFEGGRHGDGWLNYAGTFDVSIPVLALGWAVAVLAIAWRRIGPHWRRFAIGMALILAGALYLIRTNMSGVPRPWELIQFPYRAETYATLAVCALVLAAVVALPRLRTRSLRALAMGTLAAIAVMSFVQAIVQQWDAPSSLSSRSLIFPAGPGTKFPPSWYAPFDYADAEAEPDIGIGSFVAIPGSTGVGGNGESVLSIPVDGHADTASVKFISPGPGKPIDTNVYGGPYLIKVDGARVIGRSPSNQMAIETTEPKGQIATVTFSTAHSFPVLCGIAVTLLSLLTCLLLAAWACWRALRRRNLANRLRDLRTTARPPWS